jgi:hypothetical protein
VEPSSGHPKACSGDVRFAGSLQFLDKASAKVRLRPWYWSVLATDPHGKIRVTLNGASDFKVLPPRNADE